MLKKIIIIKKGGPPTPDGWMHGAQSKKNDIYDIETDSE